MATASGYAAPFSPRGKAGIVPPPPWHYVGNFLAIDFVANPEAVAALLPPGLALNAARVGHCTANFVDWQFTTDSGEELLDPIRSQYHEFLLLLHASLDGQPVLYCPYIYVDQDTALMRGLIQGYPKKHGSVYTTRTFDSPSKAAVRVEPGATFAGTLAVKDRRLAEGSVTLQEQADASAAFGNAPVVTLRYFPSLEPGYQPAVHELVRMQLEETHVSPVWQGAAQLHFFASPTEDLNLLQPVRILAGYRYTLALTVRHSQLVRQLI
ncbi:MAG: acetoacetate decarboxylase family protein [Chloroflexaceae bacterium]|nr:acetoacetate decarboxylase family protein [Chloroflexaceae bacterium]